MLLIKILICHRYGGYALELLEDIKNFEDQSRVYPPS